MPSSSSSNGRTGGEEGGTGTICQRESALSFGKAILQLDGGAIDEDGTLSSASRDRFRPRDAIVPRFAADMLGRSGELLDVSSSPRKIGSMERCCAPNFSQGR